jgi:hypothetical protein
MANRATERRGQTLQGIEVTAAEPHVYTDRAIATGAATSRTAVVRNFDLHRLAAISATNIGLQADTSSVAQA